MSSGMAFLTKRMGSRMPSLELSKRRIKSASSVSVSFLRRMLMILRGKMSDSVLVPLYHSVLALPTVKEEDGLIVLDLEMACIFLLCDSILSRILGRRCDRIGRRCRYRALPRAPGEGLAKNCVIEAAQTRTAVHEQGP